MAESPKDMDYVSKIEERAAKAGGYDRPASDDGSEAPPPRLIFVTSDTSVLEVQKRGGAASVDLLYDTAETIETDKEGSDGTGS
jgi:hypothetical protein